MLQQARLQVPTNKVCNDYQLSGVGVRVLDTQICGGDEGKTNASGCNGDSGGPLVCEVNGRWELHGAVSYGAKDCNSRDSYTVFTRITKYLNWIKINTAKTG